MNQCNFIGSFTKDPVLKELDDGKCVVNFRITTNRFYKRSDGESATEATHLDLEAWDTGARYICQVFKKGCLIAVEASAKNDFWIDKNGNDQSRIVFRVNKFHQLSKRHNNV